MSTADERTDVTPRRHGRGRRRRWLIGVASVIALVGAVALAGLPLYVFPPVENTEAADLVYVIGPPTDARLDEAERLRAAGVASRILVSVPLEGEQSAEELDICGRSYVECRHPEPFTTKGEAAMLREYAAGHDVSETIVITFTPHVARTRYIFERCYGDGTSVVAVEPDRPIWQWAYQYAYQTAAFAKAWLTPCSDESEL